MTTAELWLRPPTEDEFEQWLPRHEAAYAQEIAESGAMPARAYAAGSLVPPADIQRHPEWAALVHEPEE